MDKKGISSIVGFMVFLVVSVVLVSVFLAAYFKGIKKNTSDDTSLCFGIDLEVKSCFWFDNRINYLQIQGLPDLLPYEHAILTNVERSPGGGDIKDLVLIAKDANGREYPVRPFELETSIFTSSTDYSKFLEYSSINSVARGIPAEPKYVDVAAVVGESGTVCAPAMKPVECKMLVY